MDMNVMFTEVANPQLMQAGDVILWPGEKGKLKPLHGAASTMRGLGFSIGKNAGMSLESFEYLFHSNPTQSRLLFVTSCHTKGPKSDSQIEFELLSSASIHHEVVKDPVVSFCVQNLPINTAGELSVHDVQSIGDIIDHIPPDWFKASTEKIPFTKDHVVLDDSMELVELIRDHFNTPRQLKKSGERAYLEFDAGYYGDSIDEKPDRAFANICYQLCRLETINEYGNMVWTPHPIHEMYARLSTETIKLCMRHGVKILRPTEEFKRLYTTMIRAYASKQWIYHANRTIELVNKAKEDLDKELKSIKSTIARVAANNKLEVKLSKPWAKVAETVEGLSK